MRLQPTLDDPYRYTRDGGSGVILEARLSWRLWKLVFAPAELAVERLRQARAQRRRAFEKEVIKALFAWQRAVLLARDAGALVEEREQALVDALEAELRLKVLTGGWFDAELARHYRARKAPKKS